MSGYFHVSNQIQGNFIAYLRDIQLRILKLSINAKKRRRALKTHQDSKFIATLARDQPSYHRETQRLMTPRCSYPIPRIEVVPSRLTILMRRVNTCAEREL